jgi:hypothetical protein
VQKINFMIIRGHCKSNVDDFKRKNWPDSFVAVPRIGDQIKSSSGTIAKVYSITHSQTTYFSANWEDKEPYIIIEIGRI